MARYCVKCNNLMRPGLILECTACKHSEPINESDNILAEYRKPNMESQFTTLLQGVNRDPTAAKIYQKCAKCKTQITYALLGVDNITVYVCDCRDRAGNPVRPQFDINKSLIIPGNLMGGADSPQT
jgi:DNA-directed RNA polymerase subunit M/transcription elongation factor TFIIS